MWRMSCGFPAFLSIVEKNDESFWVPPFDRKRRRASKLFEKSFTKNFFTVQRIV
ncbi:hypothetical protein SXCC_02815 [Gluconacetobacter sp. SXCC-1]|nr:hypothetical protein SXCC_02815 [Gluconacetobacter sp. SXCC-1]